MKKVEGLTVKARDRFDVTRPQSDVMHVHDSTSRCSGSLHCYHSAEGPQTRSPFVRACESTPSGNRQAF